MTRLVMVVTKSDPRIGSILAPSLTGTNNLKYRQYWKSPDLSDISGDNGAHGLFLVGHANQINFKAEEGTLSYVSGQKVIQDLMGWGLDVSSFAYCLLAGCSAAPLNHLDGLISQVARASGLLTVASSTTVRMTPGGRIGLQPVGDGKWVVEDPNGTSLFQREDGVFVGNLDRHDLVGQTAILDKLRHSPFTLKTGENAGGAVIV